jgi:transcriptional regulator with GAF, ATPase, and Fis domain
VATAVEDRRLREENIQLKRALKERYNFPNIIGKSEKMQAVLDLVTQVAPSRSTVLISGESGTGKELIAKAIHAASTRADKAFVPVNSGSIPVDLLESQLFGHVKGAFTGAVASRKGLFEAADQGTIFFDEIATISPETQAKLLRVIQEREFRAVGDTRSQEADVRLIAATNKDLVAMVRAETFREDLYYRVNIFPIQVPPLRERREDIPALAHHFLGAFSRELGRKTAGFSDGAMSLLVNHAWPGNVRELENTVQRALILAGDGMIRKAHLASLADAAPQAPADAPRNSEELKQAKKAARERSVESIEREFVLEALRRNAWNVTRSAEDTGMLRANFQALMKKHDIRVRDLEPRAGGPDEG